MKTKLTLLALLIITSLGSSIFGQIPKNVFGFTQFYPGKSGYRSWTSEHWNNGIARTFSYSSDPYDPTDWTEDRSASGPGFTVDGKGVMKMSGGPRFHVNPLRSSKVAAQKFTNIEFTAYYKKTGTSGQNYGGMVVGMRGASNGHGSSGGNNCDAQCYMARFRNDGKWDFEKELKHPASTVYSGSGYNTQDPLWKGKKLPENKWIGMKYILINNAANTQVTLEVYIDSTSNANPINGGNWVLVGKVTDAGNNWPGGDITGCSYTNKYMPIIIGGNVFWRTDNDQAEYKFVTIREIETTPVTGNATVYKDCEYAGTTVNLPAGNYNLADLQARGILDNDISSLRVNSGYEIVLYENANFSGQSITLTGNMNCLTAQAWNDRATSLIVRLVTTTFTRNIQAESYTTMAGVQLENTTDVGGGQNVGWIDVGDWMAYANINFPSSGSYKVEYRVAGNGGQISLDLNAGAIQLGGMNVPATGSWQNWTTISHTVNVNAGTYSLGIYAVAGGWNLNWIKITKVTTARMGFDEDASFSFSSTSEFALSAYPIPSNDFITVDIPSGVKNCKVKIMDLAGNALSETQLNGNTLDISELKAGTYILWIEHDGERSPLRVVKQ
jgi:hypothetical protein